MNILVVMPVAEQRGGAEMMLRLLLRHGRNLGVRWTVAFLEDGPMVVEARELGLEVEIVRAGRLREPQRMLSCVARLAALARRERAEVVLSWMNKAHLYAGIAAWGARVPTVWFQHSTPDPPHPFDRLATLIPARGVLASSQTIARAQQKLWPHRATRVVHPGIELKSFQAAATIAPPLMRCRLGLSEAGPLIGIVGRLQKWKGMHVLIEAMPDVLRRHPDARCVIVGGEHPLEPDYPAFLEARMRALKVRERVHLAGLQNNVAEWMQAMDVVVHASDREPFGIVILEAMALGKPLVAGDQGGPREIITPGRDALLSPYGDAPALARAINRFLDDPAFAQQLGSAARQSAQQFDAAEYARRLVAAVRELLHDAHESTTLKAQQ